MTVEDGKVRPPLLARALSTRLRRRCAHALAEARPFLRVLIVAVGAIGLVALIGLLGRSLGIGRPLPPAQTLIAAAMAAGFWSAAPKGWAWQVWGLAGQRAALLLSGVALVSATAF